MSSSKDSHRNITLAKQYVSDGSVDVNVSGFSTVDHKTIDELHALCSLTSKFARYNNFTTLSSRLHDETEDTITSSKAISHFKTWNSLVDMLHIPANSQTTNKFVAQGLSLCNSTQATGGNLLSIELNSSLLKAKSLLHNRCQLANPSAFLTQNILGTSG